MDGKKNDIEICEAAMSGNMKGTINHLLSMNAFHDRFGPLQVKELLTTINKLEKEASDARLELKYKLPYYESRIWKFERIIEQLDRVTSTDGNVCERDGENCVMARDIRIIIRGGK